MRTLLLTLLCLGLLGCGWFNDDKGVFVNRSDDYLTSKETDPLDIPGDLAQDGVIDPFPIPQVPVQANPSYYPDRPPLPDAIYANDNRGEVRIQRLGERRWLVIPEAPTTVWPKIKQFLGDNGVNTEVEQPEAGRLDTQWLTVEGSATQTYNDIVRVVIQDEREKAFLTTGRDRLRLRLEQGMRRGTSEVHMRHENDDVQLPSRPDLIGITSLKSHIGGVEDALLRELGAFIAARVSEQTTSLVARDIASTEKAVLDRSPQGQPQLRLNLDYDRAWAALGQALDNAEVEVTDLNRDTRTYYVSIPDSLFSGGKKPGFLGRLVGSREKVHDLEVHLDPDADQYLISVTEAEGELADRELAQQLLILLREYAG